MREFMARTTRASTLVLASAIASVLAIGAVALEASAQETTVSHGLSAFGELKYPPDFQHFDYVNPDAPKGGALSMRPVIANRTFDSFNPTIFKGDSADGALFLMDSLMARAFDEPDAMYGLLAESVETPADRSYAVFTLRPEARFSDDTPVTAEDVAWSIETLRDKGAPQISLPLKKVETISIPAPGKVRFDFVAGQPTRDLPALVAGMPIFQKAHFDGKDFAESSLEPPVGSGPYLVGDYTAGRTVTYVRRDDYWAKDLPAMRGQYNFDRLEYEYFADHDVAFEAWLTGEFDLDEIYISRNWATKYDLDIIDKGWAKKEALADGRASGTQAFMFNTRRAKFADPQVRQALGMVFDFEWTNEKLFYGIYSRTDSFFENTDLQAEGEPTEGELALLEPYRDQLPESVFGPAATPPVTDGSGRMRRTVARAAKLLDAAGWTVQGGQRKNANGEVLRIEFLDRVGSSFDRIVAPYISNLKLLGVEASLRQVDAAQYEQRTKRFDFDVVSVRYPLTSTPGPELKGYLSSEGAEAPGSFNLAGVASPVIDALLEKVEAAASREELRAACKAVDRVFRAGHYWVPQWTSGTHKIVYWDRFGRPQDLGLEKPPYDRSIIATWWFDPERSAALDAARGR